MPQQPLVLTGNRDIGRRLNRRKLSELPYHYIKLQNWDGMQEHIMDLEFIEAKFEANMVSIFPIFPFNLYSITYCNSSASTATPIYL